MASGRFVSYHRVSTKGQGVSGLGLDAQRKAVTDYLNGGNWELVGEFVEVESGGRDDRPELMKAFDICRMTGAKLLIAKLDRLSRDTHFLTGLEKQGIDFVACDMPQANRFTVTIMAAVAEQERSAASTRTKAALATIKDRLANGEVYVSKRSGKVVERLGNPNGLSSVRQDLGVQAVKDRADKFAATVLPTIKALKASDLTLQGVADQLNKMKVLTARGSTWTPMAVKRVLDRHPDHG